MIHRHPLQNRPISPKMRVITRHSKLLYFLKHLPRWQFLRLVSAIVTARGGDPGVLCEASGAAARTFGRGKRSARWPAGCERGRALAGASVLTLAEAVAGPDRHLGRKPGAPMAGVAETTQAGTSGASVRQG